MSQIDPMASNPINPPAPIPAAPIPAAPMPAAPIPAAPMPAILKMASCAFTLVVLLYLMASGITGYLQTPPAVDHEDGAGPEMGKAVGDSPLELWWNFRKIRHDIIVRYLDGQKGTCSEFMNAHTAETTEMYEDFGLQFRDNDGYEGGKDPEKGKQLREMKAAVHLRQAFEQCMSERMVDLEGWLTVEEMARMADQKGFNWKKALLAKGICVDRNECFCDILMQPAKKFLNELKDNAKKLDAAGKKMEKMERMRQEM